MNTPRDWGPSVEMVKKHTRTNTLVKFGSAGCFLLLYSGIWFSIFFFEGYFRNFTVGFCSKHISFASTFFTNISTSTSSIQVLPNFISIYIIYDYSFNLYDDSFGIHSLLPILVSVCIPKQKTSTTRRRRRRRKKSRIR